MPSFMSFAHRSILLALLAVPAWSGDATAPIVNVTKAQAVITAAAGRIEEGVPVWVRDPTLGGMFTEGAYGSGDDLGSALAEAIGQVARLREVRIQAEVKEAARPDGKMPSKTQQLATTVFGELKVQSLLRDSITEGGAITSGKATKATSRFESITRITHPLFTIKLFSSEEGEISATESTNRAIRRYEWTCSAPVSGAQMAQACAAAGLMQAARGTLGDKPEAILWLVALRSPVPAGEGEGEGEGYLLPLQAPAVALAKALRASGQDHLLGAQVDRPAADTLRISWPQGPASLTLRLDREGAVVGLISEETLTSRSRQLVDLAKESLIAQVGAVQVLRGPGGEVWKITPR